MLAPALNIENYAADGFVKVCEVEQVKPCGSPRWGTPHWQYTNINEEVMFSEHRSWVYFIVVDQEIVKIGESGNPLGIPSNFSDQPNTGSKGRLGRYRTGDGTDWSIRYHMQTDIREGRCVSIWARRCEMVELSVTICGIEHKTMTTFHKDLEMRYLDYIFSQIDDLPRLNLMRK